MIDTARLVLSRRKPKAFVSNVLIDGAADSSAQCSCSSARRHPVELQLAAIEKQEVDLVVAAGEPEGR